MVQFMIKWCKKKQKIYTTNSEILLSLSSAKWRLLMKTFSTLVRKCRPIKSSRVRIGSRIPRDCRKYHFDAGSVRFFWRQRVENRMIPKFSEVVLVMLYRFFQNISLKYNLCGLGSNGKLLWKLLLYIMIQIILF